MLCEIHVKLTNILLVFDLLLHLVTQEVCRSLRLVNWDCFKILADDYYSHVTFLTNYVSYLSMLYILYLVMFLDIDLLVFAT